MSGKILFVLQRMIFPKVFIKGGECWLSNNERKDLEKAENILNNWDRYAHEYAYALHSSLSKAVYPTSSIKTRADL